MVVGGGFEPPKLARQIYSLIPLATREPHRSEPHILLTAQTFVNHPEEPKQVISRKLTGQREMELARGVEPPTG